MDDAPTFYVDGYETIHRLGVGAWKETWRARRRSDGAWCVVMRVLPQVWEHEEARQWLRERAARLNAIRHGAVIHVQEVVLSEAGAFLVADDVPGVDGIRLWGVRRGGRDALSLPLAAYIIKQAAEGMDSLHHAPLGPPLVHGEAGVQELQLGWDGSVKVWAMGNVIHTFRLPMLGRRFSGLAPEQVRGFPVDARTDVYGLGVMLYQFITGERPFSAESDFHMLELIRDGVVEPANKVDPAVPEALSAIASRALVRHPEGRFPTAQVMADALQAWLRQSGWQVGRTELGAQLRALFPKEYEAYQQLLKKHGAMPLPSSDDPPESIRRIVEDLEKRWLPKP